MKVLMLIEKKQKKYPFYEKKFGWIGSRKKVLVALQSVIFIVLAQ